MSNELKEAKKLLALAASVEGKPSFLMKLAQGKFDQNMLVAFDIEDVNKNSFGDLKNWLDSYLANNVDPIKINRESKVPRSVFDDLSPKLLGVKIKKEYGGLQLTALQYCLLMRTLASNSSPLGIWYTANCSIGLSGYLMVVYDSLKKELNETKESAKKAEIEKLIAKTEWQMKEFLPKLAAGANAAFGLTQVGAGSDPMAMIGSDTLAERTSDGKFHVRGHKLYNTGGTIAEDVVVMAPLAPKNSICSFIVPTSGYGEFKVTPCDFEGNRGIENGLIQFDVMVPESFLIGKETGHDGLKNALRTLNVGRLAMSAGSSATIANCLQVSRWWSRVRVQQGRPVGKYMKNSLRVAKMASDAFAVEALMNLGCAMYDKHKLDTDLRLETAAIKLWSTESAIASAVANEEVRSGHFYETYESQARRAGLVEPFELPIPDNTFLADAKVLRIGEGTSDIQELIISGTMFAPHARRLLPIVDFGIDPEKDSLRIKTRKLIKGLPKSIFYAIKAAIYYSFWIPARLVSMFTFGLIYWLVGFVHGGNWYIKYASSKLALKSLWLIVRYRGKLLREQVETSFVADQLTELLVMAAVRWSASKLVQKHGNIVNELADVHCGYAISRIKGIAKNKPQPLLDKKAYKLGQKIIFENAAEFLEKGVATVLDRERKRWGKE